MLDASRVAERGSTPMSTMAGSDNARVATRTELPGDSNRVGGIAAAGFVLLVSLLLAACSTGGSIESVTERASESASPVAALSATAVPTAVPAGTPPPVATPPRAWSTPAATPPPPTVIVGIGQLDSFLMQCPKGARVTADGQCWIPVADGIPVAAEHVYAACDAGDPAFVIVGRECRRVRPEVCGADWPVPSEGGCTSARLDVEYPDCAEYYIERSVIQGWPGPNAPQGCPEVVPWSCGEIADPACTEVIATGEWRCPLRGSYVQAYESDHAGQRIETLENVPRELLACAQPVTHRGVSPHAHVRSAVGLRCPDGARVTAAGRCWVAIADAVPGPGEWVCADGRLDVIPVSEPETGKELLWCGRWLPHIPVNTQG